MANSAIGEIDVVLDKPRVWKLSWRGVAEIENALRQLSGKPTPWTKFVQRVQDWTVHDWALVLWAGLHTSDKEIEIEQVLDMADVATFTEFSTAFMAKLADGVDRIPDAIKKKLGQVLPERSGTSAGSAEQPASDSD